MKPQISQIFTDDSTAVILRAKPEACPERSEGTLILEILHSVQNDPLGQIPHGACPERNIKILRFAQNDMAKGSE